MSDYLHECLERHGDVTRALYGKPQALQEVERLAAGIRASGRLTYDDFATITYAGLWRGGAFWQWPTRAEFNERSGDGVIDGLSILPRREKAVVDRLLGVFRHIEPVSVVLRFIDPRNFGILSPPVEKLLEMGPAHRPREKYRKYVKVLRILRDERGFATAAEVDMALWVMREVIDAEHSRSEWLEHAVPEYKRWIHGFWVDQTLRETRVRNLTESLFGTMTMAELAEALVPRHRERIKQDQVVLAARVAGIEFEQAVMQLTELRSASVGNDPRAQGLMRVTRTLDVPREIRDRWVHAVKVRNDAIHGKALRRTDVDQLLHAMREAIDRASEFANPRC